MQLLDKINNIQSSQLQKVFELVRRFHHKSFAKKMAKKTKMLPGQLRFLMQLLPKINNIKSSLLQHFFFFLIGEALSPEKFGKKWQKRPKCCLDDCLS